MNAQEAGLFKAWSVSPGVFQAELKSFMAARALTQAALAAALDCSVPAVCRWLREERLPRPVFLHRLARLMGTAPGKSPGCAGNGARRKVPARPPAR